MANITDTLIEENVIEKIEKLRQAKRHAFIVTKEATKTLQQLLLKNFQFSQPVTSTIINTTLFDDPFDDRRSSNNSSATINAFNMDLEINIPSSLLPSHIF